MSIVKTQGTTFGMGDGGDPESFDSIAQITGISGLMSGSPTEIETTTLADTFKRVIMGLKEEGEITLSLLFDYTDNEHDELITKRGNGTLNNYRITFADSSTVTFAAFVKTFDISVEMDDKLTGEATFKIDEGLTWS